MAADTTKNSLTANTDAPPARGREKQCFMSERNMKGNDLIARLCGAAVLGGGVRQRMA